jgi:hypothetical protein
MIYKKLSNLPKTLAMGLTVVGVCSHLPLPTQATTAPTPSALSVVSTASSAVTKPSFLELKLAQTPGQLASRSAATPFKTTPLLKDRGAPAPGKRVGGASRGTCPRASKNLTALVPVIPTPLTDSVLGLTFAEHPTLWFYVPYSLTATRPVEFVLFDNQGTELYRTLLSESGAAPGVMGFQIPETVPPLAVNKRYKWYLTVFCDANERSDFRSVEGWVQRVALDPKLQQKLEQATPEQKAVLYTQAGVWHEAVTTLAQLHRQNPKNATLQQQWTELMQLIDLGAIAPEPITSMLTPNK